MKNNIYAIKDIKIGQFGIPFTKTHQELAVRDFMTLSDDENSNICKYPEDFELWKIGEIDDGTGELINDLKVIVNAVQCKRKEPVQEKIPFEKKN